MKRTQVVIDEHLIEAGLKMIGFKTSRELIDFALRELLRRESQKQILMLKGKIHWEGDLSSPPPDVPSRTVPAKY
jgi:Arc/MetJ family transcription regulator